MVTADAAVVGAVGGGRRPEVGGLLSEDVGLGAAGAAGRGHGPPGRLRQGQPGPGQGAGGQVAL